MSDELTIYSATRLAKMIRMRDVSPVEVVESHLRRIETVNQSLNAIVSLASNALDLAREAEQSIMRGDEVGSLCGVPLTIKDTIDVMGLRSTAGSRARSGHLPRRDAGAVARLREAGAIIIGKTNTSEMALDYNAENPVFGRTNNPLNELLSPGGSSGGCAAAVAANLTAGSIGSDLTGSVRVPAHFCGVVGFKPTTARIPHSGHFPPVVAAYSLAASLGPIARTVEDIELLYEVLSCCDLQRPGVSYAEESSRNLRDAASYFTSGIRAPIDAETAEAVRRASSALSEAGFVVKERRPPGFETATDLWLRLFSRETQRIVCSTYKDREDLAGRAAKLILDSAACSVPQTLDDFFSAWSERDKVREHLLDWMEETPLVLAPVGAVTSLGHDDPKRFTRSGQQFGLFRAFGCAQACNVFDLPAISLPVGRTRQGFPIGVQVIGRPLEESRVLRAARIIERSLGGQ